MGFHMKGYNSVAFSKLLFTQLSPERKLSLFQIFLKEYLILSRFSSPR